MRTIVAFLLLAACGAGLARADEGQWPPDQLADLDWKPLRARGLALTPQEIWSKDGTGLAQAIVNLEGCSASFVSSDGLIVTNHHCLYGAIQQHSTKDRDYLREGFVARSRPDELPAKAQRVLVLRRIEDVTSRFKPTVAAERDDEARQRAIEKMEKAIVAGCERKAATRCRVASYFGGLRFVLFESQELRDVRLVYAPPAGVGDFGGEADNWRWPRHTGDFAFARAYVAPDGSPAEYAPGNVPFRPGRFLRVAQQGVAPGDLVLIFGYPGRTERYGTEAAVQRDLAWLYPRRLEFSRGYKAVLEDVARRDGEAAVRVADSIKSAANRTTNADAMIAGLRRNGVVEARRARGASLAAFIAADPARGAKYGTVVQDLDVVLQGDLATRERDFLLSNFAGAVKPFGAAQALVRWAGQRDKPDLDRDAGYQDRDRSRVRGALEKLQKDLHPLADRATFAWYLGRALDLPEGQRIVPLDDELAGALKPGADRKAEIDAYVERVLAATRLTTVEGRLALFDVPPAQAMAADDPLVRLALRIEPLRIEAERAEKARLGAYARLRPLYFEALLAWKGNRALYPDANSTLRLAFATVKGYSPRDGVTALPQTTLDGMLAKHTGAAPFDVPDQLRGVASRRDFGPWAANDLGSVPVGFLADGDTTGGNSGSPVLNGRGELVGLNFDRVWENVAGDYGWNARYSRNISVDIRFALWMLDRVDGAAPLLRELGF